MRRRASVVVGIGVLASLALLAATSGSTLAQGGQTGQERFVVFEMFSREA